PEVSPIQILEQPLAPEFLEQRLVLSQRLQIGDDGLVRDDEVAGVHRAVDRRLDALLEIGDEIPGVPPEDLVAALPAEQDLAVAAREPGHHELRERARPGHGIVEVIDNLPNRATEALAGDSDLVGLKAPRPGQAPGKGPP